MSHIKLVMIGAGNIAEAHLAAFRHAGGDIVGICTRSDHGRTFAQTHSITHYDSNLSQLIETTMPDGILILTQPSAYESILKTLSPFNLPVFIEKPLGYTLKDLVRLRPLLPVKTMVGLNRRFYSNLQPLPDLIAEDPECLIHGFWMERLKDFIHRDEHTRRHWPMMNALHLIDLLAWLAPPTHSQEAYTRHWGTLPELPDASQFTEAGYTTPTGTHVRMSANIDSPGGWRIHVFQKQREIIVSPIEKTVIKTLSGLCEVDIDPVDTSYKPGFVRQAETFLAGLQANPESLPPSWIGVDQAAISMQLTEQWFA